MNIVGLLPMKGHSERVPGKNLRAFVGRPLYHRVAETLLSSERVDRLVVDTDSDEIAADVDKSFPEAEIHRRPAHLLGDFTSMHEIVAHLASVIEGDVFLQTHATNPLLRPETVDRAIESYVANDNHDSLVSVTSRRSRFFFSDGQPVNHDPALLQRTQDLVPLLEENSNLYIASRSVILSTGHRYGEQPLLFTMDSRESFDIDTEFDFRVAEFFFEHAS